MLCIGARRSGSAASRDPPQRCGVTEEDSSGNTKGPTRNMQDDELSHSYSPAVVVPERQHQRSLGQIEECTVVIFLVDVDPGDGPGHYANLATGGDWDRQDQIVWSPQALSRPQAKRQQPRHQCKAHDDTLHVQRTAHLYNLRLSPL